MTRAHCASAITLSIITVWDQFSRDLPEFPEVFSDRQFELLEKVPRATLTRALAVIADSPAGARRIASLYHVDPGRIIELPFVPSLAVRRHKAGGGLATFEEPVANMICRAVTFSIPRFPPPKNHLYLLEGLVRLSSTTESSYMLSFAAAARRRTGQ